MVQQQDWTNFSLQRPNYFPGQYLLDEDFELAHKYLNDRQRYVNSKLHLSGIVEGLEVEVIAGQDTITIKSGTAIDGLGNLIILPKEKIDVKINSTCWVCLRYYQEAKILQQPEIPDSFTRFVEEPLVTLEAIETQDAKTVTLAKILLENGQVRVDSTVRQYSGARLPSGQNEEISLRSDGKSLTIKGNLSISGTLALGGNSEITAVSESIDTESDRTTVIPSEKAVKEHIEKRIVERLASLNVPTEENPAISLTTQPDGKMYGWKTEGGEPEDKTSVLKLIAYRAGIDTQRLSITRDTGSVSVNGAIHALHLVSSNPMQHRMYPNDAIVYQDIFDAREAGAIRDNGEVKNAPSDRLTRHQTNMWNDRRMLCYGGPDEDDAGAEVIIPQGYDTAWVRVSGDNWLVIKAKFLDGSKEELGRWTAGKRHGNCYCPDGSLTDGYHNAHQWLPIPAGRAGRLKLVSKTGLGGGTTGEFWISGLAFSKNPWSHATQSAIGYYWKVNGGNQTTWRNDSGGWNGDILTTIPYHSNVELLVPIVWSGRDKLLYMVEYNSDWNGCMHSSITVNGQSLDTISTNQRERFLASYDNPFARHWNSKAYNRYIAARIPANLIPKPTDDPQLLLSVRIDMSKQNAGLSFREMGTHDLEVPNYSV